MSSQNVASDDTRIDWVKSIPIFILWGVAVIGPFFTGLSWTSVAVAGFLYFVRMFFVTGFFHRYFSHRSFKAPVWFQNVMATLACTAVQKGALWWAYTHRHHHGTSDSKEDVHSTLHRGSWWAGFRWAHYEWILVSKYHGIPKGEEPTDLVRQNPLLLKFENPLVYVIPPTILGIMCYVLGEYLGPAWNTTGAQMVIVGFFLSTFVLFNGTSAINSLAHSFGSVRYNSGDHSKNSFLLALITLGEGWHNNHHYKQVKANQGETAFELCFDWTYWILWVLHLCKIIEIPRANSHLVPRTAQTA